MTHRARSLVVLLAVLGLCAGACTSTNDAGYAAADRILVEAEDVQSASESGNDSSATESNGAPDVFAATEYTVRMNVRLHDASVIEGRMTYKFRTLGASINLLINQSINQSIDPVDASLQQMRLEYQSISPSSISIKWEVQSTTTVDGFMVLYSTSRELSPTQWMKILVSDARRRELTLTELKSNTTYFIR